MKKVFMVALMALGGFVISGCDLLEDDEKLNVVATIFPYYDIASNVIGEDMDNIDLQLLMDTGVDLHSYQATTDDIIAISNADVLIYNGGESDEWIFDAIESADNDDLVVINVMELLDDNVLEEEVVEGMEEHEHDDEESEEEHDEEETENDEHLWLSIKNAKIVTEAIVDVMSEVDSDNSETYTELGSEYVVKLDDLDSEYEEVISNSEFNTIVVADRFPFRYLVEDYNLEYYAAFAGCSSETEASFETIVFLAEKLNELDLNYVLTIDGSDASIAETVVSSSDDDSREILVLNSMQSLGESDVTDGVTYISIMEENLEVLKKVLN